MLYTPKVAPDAIPPNNYPASWGPTNVIGLIIVTVLCWFVGCARLINDGGVLPTTAVLFMQWLALMTVGYGYVSAVTLQRPTIFGSRYGGCGEWLKLVLTSPVLFGMGPATGWAWLLRAGGSPAHSSQWEWEWAWEWLWHVVVPYVVALHFTYLDNNATLQSLGCKFPVPSRWPTLTVREAMVLLACSTGTGWAAYAHARALFHDPLRLSHVVALYATVGAAVGCGAWWWRGTHNLHFHHYMLGLVFMPVFGCASASSVVCVSLSTAVYVEGIAVWGMDPLFVHTASNADDPTR